MMMQHPRQTQSATVQSGKLSPNILYLLCHMPNISLMNKVYLNTIYCIKKSDHWSRDVIRTVRCNRQMKRVKIQFCETVTLICLFWNPYHLTLCTSISYLWVWIKRLLFYACNLLLCHWFAVYDVIQYKQFSIYPVFPPSPTSSNVQYAIITYRYMFKKPFRSLGIIY